MPLNKDPLPLRPDPESVHEARQWVSGLLKDLGRADLVDAAELGVSELVTNAILHGDPPINVRLRGTSAHPRVEVHDHSRRPPETNVEMTDEDQLLSTVGRGLGIMSWFAAAWGSDVTPEGKSVWFEPTAEMHTDHGPAGNVFDFEAVEELAEEDQVGEWLTIRLVGMPVQVFAQFRQRYSELRRELRILALAHGNEYPIARELSEITVQVEKERRRATGVGKLDEAISRGMERVDLEYGVPPSAPATMAKLTAMLDQADAFCHEQRLLVLAASPQEIALQHWYFGEFIRQANGEEPLPWPGGYTVETSDW
jgi:anti-sigma regulatory factor (Ser/Thr protein kinase)